MRKMLRGWLRRQLQRRVEVEVIGQDECPMMLRWEFLNLGFVKAMIHYFPPEVSDRDPHDHPRPFFTLVLRGHYRDESWQRSDSEAAPLSPPIKERVTAGAIRYRKAEHLHIVETDEAPCWTLVVMGPIVREWGFVRLLADASEEGELGSWWPWGKYIQRFGGVVRCDAPADTMGQDIPLDQTAAPADYEGGGTRPERVVHVVKGQLVGIAPDAERVSGRHLALDGYPDARVVDTWPLKACTMVDLLIGASFVTLDIQDLRLPRGEEAYKGTPPPDLGEWE